jgi:hypothetical protein
MGRKKVVLSAGIWSAVAIATLFAGLWGADVLSQLGLSEAIARENALRSLESGSVPVWLASKAFKAATPTARASLVTGALAWAKAYAQSTDFQAAYAKMRDQFKPAPLEFKGSVDDELIKQRSEQAKQIEEMRTQAKKLPPETQQQMEKAIKDMTAQFDKMAKDPQSQALLKQMADADRAEKKKRYESNLKQWQTKYPADSRVLIARRLREFLETSASVNFEAKLMPNGGKMQYADPVYEGKTHQWKICYRAGRQAVEAARSFSQSWLTELESAK